MLALASRHRLGAALAAGARAMSTVRYSKHGDPRAVLQVDSNDDDVSKLGANDVALKFLAAPINPADFNMVEGTYGVQPELPAVGGNEGVAQVTATGSGVSGLASGDWVIPAGAGFGTWRSVAKADAGSVLKVPNDLSVEAAATLAVAPCTALRLLTDFGSLQAGDVVVQNGGNSTVGQAVIQIAKARGLKTVSIVRDRAGSDEVVEHLKALGGHVVVTDSFTNTPAFVRLLADLPAPKLGLNCTGGKTATDVARCLGSGATMVTYGGMARRGVSVPTAALIFNDISLRGFWMSRWNETAAPAARQAMIDEVVGLIRAGNLNLWLERHDFGDFAAAVEAAKQPYRARKVVLTMA